MQNMTVALRKESVDRNTKVDNVSDIGVSSLSVRRAWIEITVILNELQTISGRSP